jgi:tetratricopeptide (TPR) repeat protein
MIGDNPIRRRFAWLHDQWVSFAENPDARVLCWQLEADESELFDAFLAKESDDQIGELPDLFLRLTTAFEQEGSYGFALREELWHMTQELADSEDAELGEVAPWQPPPLTKTSVGTSSLLAACESFCAHHQLPGQLALVLNPGPVGDVNAFARWLLSAARQMPPPVRFIVLDAARQPQLAQLLAGDSKRVTLQAAALDMPRALADTSRNAGGLDTPGGMFRQLFVSFSGALGRQDLNQAEQLAERALAITAAQGWHALSLPIHMALATAYSGAGRSNDAHTQFMAAEQTARAGEVAGDPTCAKLRLQARMARGSLWIAESKYEEAAAHYEQTLPEAHALGDPLMIIDCQRLGSFCREQAGDLRAALRHGAELAKYARGVAYETRKNTTLPFVGEAMRRLAKKSALRADATRTAREIDELLQEPQAAAQTGAAQAEAAQTDAAQAEAAPETGGGTDLAASGHDP